MTSDQSQVRAREGMIYGNLDRIEAVVRRARRITDEEIAALVLDPRDEHARAILEFACRPADYEARLAEAARRGERPIVVRALPRRLVLSALRDRFPELADSAARLDSRGGFLAVAAAGGGAAAVVVRPGDSEGGRPIARLILP